jgi:hypothetical protein
MRPAGALGLLSGGAPVTGALVANGLAFGLGACASHGSLQPPANANAPEVAAANAQPTPAPTPEGPIPPLISYCELVHEPVKYLGEDVRVVGVYRGGFEWMELYSTRCPDARTTWVEDGLGECTPPVVTAEEMAAADKAAADDPMETSGATFGVVVRGTLYGGDGKGYGHLNAYTFAFVPVCAEDMEWLDSASYTPEALTRAMRRNIEKYLKRHEPTAGAVGRR